MSLKVQAITEPLLLGESPHWDERQQALFFLDSLQGEIHKYVLATGDHTKTKLDGRIGFILPVEGTTNRFVVGLERTFHIVQWDGAEGSTVQTVKDLGSVDQDVEPNTRINDGKADARGRLFAGTLGKEESPGNYRPEDGSFYRVDGRGISKLCDKIGISNGMSWDLKEKAMYYTDSLEQKIRRYDYDIDTGEISNMTYAFDLKKNGVDGLPDGNTIDTDGNLWVAVFNSSSVIKVDPRSGSLLQIVPIPALQVTSVTFGGPNYDVLFVTSASMESINGVPEAPCGATFMVTGLGVKGQPSFNFKLS